MNKPVAPGPADPPRGPKLFRSDDPSLVAVETVSGPGPGPTPTAGSAATGERTASGRAALQDIRRGIGWGAMLLSAMTALAMLAAGVWFARFVSVALARQDWVGWTATGLLAVAGVAAVAIVVRELIGLLRLGRLANLRRDADTALRQPDAKLERTIVGRLRTLLAGRPDCRWGIARLDEHLRDVRDPGDLLKLADRDLLAPLDQEARRIIVAAAKRVGMVTAMSPLMLVSVAFVLIENVRMLRAIATLYGGRPGTAGSLRLGRMVISHIVASGGLALTDDMFGQFLGQDVLRRLSRRLGEGAFNGAMTARIGAAAIEVIRPLPFMDAKPVRIRDLLGELFKRPANGKSDPA